MIVDRDPYINWELGWKSIKKEVKRIQKERDIAERARIQPEDELFELRLAASDPTTPVNQQRLRDLEMEIRRRERMNAHLWHLHSKSTWFKIGDAPNKYFFMLVTAKRIRETIKKLALADGWIMEDKNEILHGVFTHYKNLYRQHPRVARFQIMRDEVQRLITRKFPTVENSALKAILSDDEIDRIVLGFPKGKSPGGDGVTYEFL